MIDPDDTAALATWEWEGGAVGNAKDEQPPPDEEERIAQIAGGWDY